MNSLESGRVASVTLLFIVAAAMEVGAGLILLAVPAAVIGLLFGPAADLDPAVGIARLTGAALLSLGAAYWWARHEVQGVASRGLVGAMLIYNVAVVVLGLAGALGAVGPLQLAAVVLHGTQAVWCAWVVAHR